MSHPIGIIVGMFEVLEDVHAWLRLVVSDVDREGLSGEDAAMGVVFFAEVEKLAAAGKAFCAARVKETHYWQRQGDRTPAHFVARVSGCSMAEARAATEVPDRLRSLPATDEEFRTGGLRLAQARHITEAAIVDPAAEARLLEIARREPLGTLREECLRVKSAACVDDEARYRAIHSSRYLRHWTDASGAFRVDASMTPDAGAEVLAVLKPLRRELGLAARRRGCKERREALAADALVELCRRPDAEGRRVRPRVNINVRVDASAWARGQTQAGEVCEIDGAGPIPVSVAERLAEGRVNPVDLDSAEVVSISTTSRYIPAPLRRALIVRDPTCVVAGCYERDDLEIDHVLERENGGRTCLTNLCRLCKYHHSLKTHRDWTLHGKGNNRVLLPPERPPEVLTPA